MIELELKTKVFPTEDEEILRRSFNKIFPFEKIELSPPDKDGTAELVASAQGLDSIKFLFTQVRRQKTVQAVRDHTHNKMDFERNHCKFDINKQALVQGFIVLCTAGIDSPMGPVSVKISAQRILPVMEWLFPPTEEGKVLEVAYKPVE